MELYVRMNDDVEYDYAFQVDKDDTLASKTMKIFDPEEGLSRYMVLRPSIFYKDTPVGFYKSMHPGFLTENGCLLFDYDAGNAQYLEKLDLDKKKVWEQLWPGQLVIPAWEKDKRTILVFVFIMLGWLYTDLPDCISPTPGICLTNQFSKRVMHIADYLGYHAIATKLGEEIQPNSAGVTAQWLFFAFHLVKLLVISSLFYTGLINPISFNPVLFYNSRKFVISKNNEKLKSTLQKVGWIGARRATYDDYRDTYYNYVIEKCGGPVSAYKMGVMKNAASPGLTLSAGEGFQTDLKNRLEHCTFSKMESARKFELSEDYFLQLEKDLKENIKKCKDDIPKCNAEIRRFRKYGLFECGEELSKLVAMRKEVDTAAESKPQDEQEKKEQ